VLRVIRVVQDWWIVHSTHLCNYGPTIW